MSLQLADILLSIPVALLAISVHECAHGYAAFKLGDPTPKLYGRITLNPLAHLDLIGTIMLIIFHFGWAKPVPIDLSYFKKPRRDIVIVSLAGPTANLLLAIAFGLLIRILPPISWALFRMLFYGVLINLALMAFNLIPIPPLDGSKVLYMLLPPKYFQVNQFLERWGMIILLILVVSGAINYIIGPIITVLLNIII